MRLEIVPVDIVSEQKQILGYCSYRQALYVAVFGFAFYNFCKLLDLSMLTLPAKVIVWTLIAVPFGLSCYALGFLKLKERDMYFDFFFLIWIKDKLLSKNRIYRHGE